MRWFALVVTVLAVAAPPMPNVDADRDKAVAGTAALMRRHGPDGPVPWLSGDPHVHAAGDSGVDGHPRCKGLRSGEAACAELLVTQTLARAKRNGLSWLIYTEHVPWLGANPTDRTICLPPLHWPCKTVPWFEHNQEQAERQYGEIRVAAEKLAPRYGVRALMGQEMGTAGHVTLAVAALKNLGVPTGLFQLGDCPGVEAGHLGLYYTPHALRDTVFDCDESAYLGAANEAHAWGAVNHPDNPDGGSRWFCWNMADTSPIDASPAPDGLAGSTCATGAYDQPGEARAVEIINDDNMPSDQALREVDALLLEGRRVALTGGSDSHTAKPSFSVENTSVGALMQGGLVLNLHQGPGNDGKIGLVGRTYVPPDGVAVSGGFHSEAGDDPIRSAIEAGRTVASTGPLGLPTVNGKGPGDTLDVTTPAIDVRVDFWDAAVAAGNGEVEPGEDQPTRMVAVDGDEDNGRVDRVNVVLGRVGGCLPDPKSATANCMKGDNRELITHKVSDGERRQGYATVHVDVPADLRAGYIRTETLFAPVDSDNFRFQQGFRFDQGAFASPIYLVRAPATDTPRVGVYPMNYLITMKDGYEVTLSEMVVTPNAVKITVRYRNLSSREDPELPVPGVPPDTGVLGCSGMEFDSAMIFGADRIEQDDGTCARDSHHRVLVPIGASTTSWASYPVHRHGGAMFSLDWWGWAVTPANILLPRA